MDVTLNEAKANLARLLDAVDNGYEIVIQRPGRAAIRLRSDAAPARRAELPEALRGLVPDVLEPAGEQVSRPWEGTE